MIHINTKMQKIISKKDSFIIAAILLTGIIVITVIYAIRKMNPGKTAVITVGSEVLQEIQLDNCGNHKFEIENLNVVFEVNDGRIRITESDCPDKICVKTGYISSVGEKIVCLPKKLIVEIED